MYLIITVKNITEYCNKQVKCQVNLRRSEMSSEHEKNIQSFVKSCLYFVYMFFLFVYTVMTLFTS